MPSAARIATALATGIFTKQREVNYRHCISEDGYSEVEQRWMQRNHLMDMERAKYAVFIEAQLPKKGNKSYWEERPTRKTK